MARRRDPKTGKLLPEGIHPLVSERTGEITYRARISYGPKGSRRHISKVEKTSSAAIEWRLQRLAELNHGSIIDATTVTCDEFFRTWYTALARHRSGSRATTVRNSWRLYASPVIGHKKIQSVRHHHIQQVVDAAVDAGLASSTSELYLIGYRQMFNDAIRKKIIRDNPCHDIIIEKTEMEERPVWNPLQIQKFLENESESRYFPLWVLLLGLSCRIGEAVALRWEDINLETGVVWIRRTVTRDRNGKVVIENRTKGGKDGRTVTMEPWVQEAIMALPRVDERVLGCLGSFKSTYGKSKTIRAAAKRAGLPSITPHGLRHASATAMAMNGVEESIVQDILGHKGDGETTKIYIHVDLESKRKGTSSLAKVLGKLPSDTTTSGAKLSVLDTSASEVRQNEKDENDKTG